MMDKFELIPPNAKKNRNKKRDTSKTNQLTKACINYFNGLDLGFLFRVQKGLVIKQSAASFKGQPTIKLVRPVGMINGIFDIIGIEKNGKFVAIEIKVGKDKLSERQIEFGRTIFKNNGLVLTVGTFQEFQEKIELIKQSKSSELFSIFLKDA